MGHEIITEKLVNMGKFGEYLSSKFGISPSAAILSVIIGFIACAYMLVKSRQWRSKEKRMLMRSKSLAQLYGGEHAWRRLNNYKAALAIPHPLDETDLRFLKGLLDNVDEQQLDFNEIKRVEKMLEKEGGDGGLRILRSAHVQHPDKSFLLHEIELAVVEMLIYQGKNPQDLLSDEFECLDYQQIQFDARPPFFKAIIHGMLGKWDDAARCWDDFVDMRDSLISIVGEGTLPAGKLHRISDFQNFKQRVQNLRNEIIKAKQ